FVGTERTVAGAEYDCHGALREDHRADRFLTGRMGQEGREGLEGAFLPHFARLLTPACRLERAQRRQPRWEESRLHLFRNLRVPRRAASDLERSMVHSAISFKNVDATGLGRTLAQRRAGCCRL